MTDIVERLNDRAVCSIAHNSCRNDARMLEAAAEIERLREALRLIADPDNYGGDEGEKDATLEAAKDAAWDAIRDAARAAAWDAAWNAAREAAWNSAWDTAWDVEWNAAWDTAWNAAWEAEIKRHAEIFREVEAASCAALGEEK